MSNQTDSKIRLHILSLIGVPVRFITESCYQCGVNFALDEEFYDRRQRDKASFYCPNGHAQHYLGKTEEQKLRDELAATEQSLKWARSREEAQRRERRAAERSAAAYKGVVTKLRNRISNGVCPVQGCQRSFQDVRRHISSKHPEWAHEHPEALVVSGE